MIMIAINFLKNHLLGAFAAAFVLGIAAKLAFQQIEINHLHNQLTLCSTQNAALENSNNALIGSVASQNAAISVLQAQSDRKMNNAAHALAAAKVDAGKYAAIASQIKAQHESGNECADMRLLVENYTKSVP